MERRWLIALHGLAAVTVLVVLVVGFPLLLVREVGWPLPTALPSWDQVTQTIVTGGVEDATLIKGLAVLVWLAWANFTAGLIVEVVALARRRASCGVAGLRSAQRLAANLLATVSIAIAAMGRPTPPSTAADPGELRLVVAAALAEQPPQRVDLAEAPSSGRGGAGSIRPVGEADSELRPSSGAEALASYTVQRGDTLWGLAERFLGDGLRWREIRDLNVGWEQPDGRVVGVDTEDLLPGWRMVLPTTGASALKTATESATEAGEAVVVERGDTLWDIADQHLEDPYRWPEIFEENQGIPQPDGGALSDPDLIRPGWTLHMPEPSETSVAPDLPSEELEEHETQSAETASPPPVDKRRVKNRGSGFPRSVQETASDEPASAASESLGSERRDVAGQLQPANTEDDALEMLPLVAAGTLTAGFVLTLDRIRRARLRRREPGRRLPLPTGAEAEAERQLRAVADEQTCRFIDLSLRELASHYDLARPTPPITLVTYSRDDLAVHLEAPLEAAPAGWETHDRGSTWRRSHPADLANLEPHAGTPSRFPTLITVGTSSDGRVCLIDLACARTLHVHGEAGSVERLLVSLAIELSTTRRADALDVFTVGLEGLPSGLERLTVLESPHQLKSLLEGMTANGKLHVPKTVVLARALPTDVAALLRTTTELRPDVVAAIADLPSRSGRWTLQVEGSGQAHLDPLDATFELIELDNPTVMSAARLLNQALHDPDQLVPLDDLDAEELEATPPLDDSSNAGEPEPEPSVEVRILGPVEIVGTAEPFRTNKTIELIVYLALHRSGADTDTLLEALWPGQAPRPARLYTEASRARKALGAVEDGVPHLPDAELGRYRLSSTVALDYEHFAERVAAAGREPARAIEHLTDALTLVRGVPLSITATEYAWATNECYRLAQEVVDVAHDLAQLCLRERRYDDAIWAAEQGLLADPLAEVLVRDLMEAAASSGNTARAHAAMTRLRRQVAEDGDARRQRRRRLAAS